jgi:hypothetical protein
MARSIFNSLFVITFLTAASALSVQADTLTYPDLVKRLYDLDHLAVPPQKGEYTVLASSYDRASTYDAKTDTYHNWDANGDGGGIIRKEGDESVLMDVQGPGCIYRTWSATTDKGHVKIYLDGDTTPAVDLPFTAYFDHSAEPFTRPNLVYKTPSNGFDNFTPIPFQKSCKIVADDGWGAYYHFNYTKFPAGTVVPTFKLPLSTEDNAALDTADKIMANAGTNPAGTRDGEKTDKVEFTIKPGDKGTVADLSGSGAITAIKVNFPIPTDPAQQKNLLRQLAIRITWDGQSEPAVWSPIGDFFADAMLPVKYKNLVTGITDDGQWYTYWYMPYSSHAHVQVVNDSPSPIAMSWEVSHAPLDHDKAKALLRFHAKWHRDAFLPKRADREIDWTLLKTEGTGRYVGTQLHVWNPRGGWWGEGDEKWFVDGEKFPSSIGTGSEDYFGFAWSSGSPFHEPLHGQPATGDDWHATLYRWHIADDIPFHTGFEGAIEKYFPNSKPTLFAAVAFWYLNPGGDDPYKEISVSERVGYWATPAPEQPIANLITPTPDSTTGTVAPDPQMIEGESMKPIVGDAEVQGLGSFGTNWSGNTQLWFRAQRIGAHSENEFQAPNAGKYKLTVRLTMAPDYGIVQIGVNGKNVGGPIDCYHGLENGKQVVPTPPIDLGSVELKSGANILNMEIVGSQKGGCLAGLDYIKLTPEP